MIKAFLWMAVGAAGALEVDKRLEGVRARFSPRAITDSVFERMNQQLEKRRTP